MARYASASAARARDSASARCRRAASYPRERYRRAGAITLSAGVCRARASSARGVLCFAQAFRGAAGDIGLLLMAILI